MEPDNKRVATSGYRILGYRVDAGDAGEKKYAIATETYVSQDGWVLRADGMTLHGHQLPILYNHGWSDEDAIPKGRWENINAVGNEIHAVPRWASNLTESEKVVKGRIDDGLLSVSIRFVIEDWHAPDPAEKQKYKIPDDAPYAGIATRWRALEASFVGLPADGKCGPRELAELHARALRHDADPTDERIKAIEARQDLILAKLESIEKIANRIASVPAVERGADAGTACAPAGSSEPTHTGDASRSLYNKELLNVSLDRLQQLIEGKTVKKQ